MLATPQDSKYSNVLAMWTRCQGPHMIDRVCHYEWSDRQYQSFPVDQAPAQNCLPAFITIA